MQVHPSGSHVQEPVGPLPSLCCAGLTFLVKKVPGLNQVRMIRPNTQNSQRHIVEHSSKHRRLVLGMPVGTGTGMRKGHLSLLLRTVQYLFSDTARHKKHPEKPFSSKSSHTSHDNQQFQTAHAGHPCLPVYSPSVTTAHGTNCEAMCPGRPRPWQGLGVCQDVLGPKVQRAGIMLQGPRTPWWR